MIDFGDGIGLTHRVLDAMSVRARATLHNLANQNTPGFKRYEVSFEDELSRAHARGDDVTAVRPVVHRDTSGGTGTNNVSMFDEAATLDKVRMVYEFFSQRAGGYFARLNKAIHGRA
jgi:flagellar basal body rod protein FlgB